jgi:nucleotide-binding universal stress UspA family protein
MVTLKKVLVATDFGEASAAALRYGRALATAFGAVLQVLHVTENLALMPLASLEGNVGLPPEVQEDIERAARQQTERLLTEHDRRWLDAQAVTITSDRTADTIIEFARANNVDLIVIGTHGRRALARLVMGSVAERIVRTAPCPVLTVHSLQHEFVGTELPVTAEAEAGL